MSGLWLTGMDQKFPLFNSQTWHKASLFATGCTRYWRAIRVISIIVTPSTSVEERKPNLYNLHSFQLLK